MSPALARTELATKRRDITGGMLRDMLGATTSYAPERKPRRAELAPKWSVLYGWQFVLVPDGILDADGKHTGFKIERQFSHKPGDIITSRGGHRTRDLPARYMVRADHSLRKI